MAATGISFVNSQQHRRGFIELLSSAACEWLLIFFLFVEAALSYFLTKFAFYCKLQTPCLLCSRLDHVIGNEKPGCYWSLFCSNHRAKISCLISCHIHDKLADVGGMCEECFMSIIMQNKSNSESYRLLVGKLGVDFEQSGSQSLYLNTNFASGSSSSKICSCCNKPCRAKTNPQRLLHLTPVGFGASKANIKPPLPRVAGRSRFSRRDSFKRIRDKFSGSMSPRHKGNTAADPLSHVGYTELKISSDSESEVPFSDDDDVSSVFHDKTYKECFVVQSGSENYFKGLTPDETSVGQTHPGTSILDQSLQVDASKPSEPDFGEHKKEKNDATYAPPSLPELIALDDIPPSPNVVEDPFGVLAENSKTDVSVSQMPGLHVLSELIALKDVPLQSNVDEAPLGVSPEKSIYVSGTSDGECKVVTEQENISESLRTTNEESFMNSSISSIPNDKELANEPATNTGKEVSRMLAEQPSVSEHSKVNEDLKLSPQLLSTRDMNLPLSPSPRPYGHHDGFQKNDSGYESLDGSSVSEIEGESVADRLKRQVEYDRRCMVSLYKELEEERSAASIAANQAMAMITRLQEEKAALHMEALQYLRMMEEQAEYDMEALEKANDLLAEKEKDLQDLEAELEFYKNNLRDESAIGNPHEEETGVKSNINAEYVPSETISTEISEGKDDPSKVQTSVLDFEDEKLYISQCLKRLERKLHQVSSEMHNGACTERITDGVENKEMSRTHVDHQKDEHRLSMERDLSASNRNAHDGSVIYVEDNQYGSNVKNLSKHSGVIDVSSLENEISDLHDRLEALEADRDFIDHAFNSLQNGNEGFKFIKEIARQLQELRKVEFKSSSPSVP